MRVGRPDALAIFERWRAARALVRVECRCADFTGAFRARVLDVSGAEIRLMADDLWAEFVFTLREDFNCIVGDFQEQWPHMANRYRLMLVIELPRPRDPDRLVFAELADEHIPAVPVVQ